MNPFFTSVVNQLSMVPNEILNEDEKQYFGYLLSLMPIDSENVDKLRETQVTLSSGFANLQYMLVSRLTSFKAQFAPIRARVESEAEKSTEYKITDKKREAIVAAHPDCAGWIAAIEMTENLLDNLKHQQTAAEHRQRMLYEKSITLRRIEERS